MQIIDYRGSGKTSRLILLALENNGTIVAKNPDYIYRKKQGYGITGIVKCISYQDFWAGDYDKSSLLYIDELSDLIAYKSNLGGFTLTKDGV